MKSYLEQFQKYVTESGLKNTMQRARIVELFMGSKGHLSTEEVYDIVRKVDSSVGQSTVYRTMKLLCESGLANEVHLGDGVARYEPAHEEHHDHLVCEKCGKTVEILSKKMEKMQENIAKKHGFVPTSHTMCLYGVCADCRKKRSKGV